MTDFDYGAWSRDMQGLTAELMGVFESRHGYQPGRNAVVTTDGVVDPDAAHVLPESLRELYAHVAEVSLPDVHVGYFVHPVGRVFAGLDGSLPTEIRQHGSLRVITFGSDGGGGLFAVEAAAGSPVYLLPPGMVAHGVYEDPESRARPCAADVPDFLRQVKQMVVSFLAEDYAPGRYLT